MLGEQLKPDREAGLAGRVLGTDTRGEEVAAPAPAAPECRATRLPHDCHTARSIAHAWHQ